MMITSEMDVFSFCDGFNNHHIGTLRCRQEGASTPSTEPVGKQKAVTATARTIAVLFYNAVRFGMIYHDPGAAA